MSADINGIAMLSNTRPLAFLLLGSLLVAGSPAGAREVGMMPVNIFGDGNPKNGVEDGREPIRGDWRDMESIDSDQLNAGTIKCDGKIRGTAMVVDTREYSDRLEGAILISAAHVLYDLEKQRLFRRCKFHFMGWNVAGYRAKLDLNNVKMGSFDPRQSTGSSDFGEGDWAFIYVRKPWRHYRPGHSIQTREFSFEQLDSYHQSGGKFGLRAFDLSTGVISDSKNCQVVESDPGDLGGGAWEGQLLDDCDSTDGASGGGIIATLNQQQYLIGVRSGSHWSEQFYPFDEYPEGPPEGAAWGRRINTNFGRALDARLMVELIAFIELYD